MTTAPFWSNASFVSAAEEPREFQVSLEDMVSETGQLVEGDLSAYGALATNLLRYDSKAKHFVPGIGFKPQFGGDDAASHAGVRGVLTATRGRARIQCQLRSARTAEVA